MRASAWLFVGLSVVLATAGLAAATIEIGTSPDCGLLVRAYGTLPGTPLPAGLGDGPADAAFEVRACEDGLVAPDLLLIGGCEAEPALALPLPVTAVVCLPDLEATLVVCTDMGICVDVV